MHFTDKFQPIDTSLLINSTCRVATNLGLNPVVNAGALGGQAYTTVQFPDLKTSDLGGLTPQLWVRNRNDGATACKLFVGLFRLLCANGMILGDDVYHDRIIHVKGPRIDEFINTFEIAAKTAIESIGSTIDAAYELTAQQVTETQAISIVGNLNMPVSVKDSAIYTIVRGNNRPEDKPNTVWGLYNIVNEFNRRKAVRGSQAYLQREESLLTDIQALYTDLTSKAA